MREQSASQTDLQEADFFWFCDLLVQARKQNLSQESLQKAVLEKTAGSEETASRLLCIIMNFPGEFNHRIRSIAEAYEGSSLSEKIHRMGQFSRLSFPERSTLSVFEKNQTLRILTMLFYEAGSALLQPDVLDRLKNFIECRRDIQKTLKEILVALATGGVLTSFFRFLISQGSNDQLFLFFYEQKENIAEYLRTGIKPPIVCPAAHLLSDGTRNLDEGCKRAEDWCLDALNKVPETLQVFREALQDVLLQARPEPPVPDTWDQTGYEYVLETVNPLWPELLQSLQHQTDPDVQEEIRSKLETHFGPLSPRIFCSVLYAAKFQGNFTWGYRKAGPLRSAGYIQEKTGDLLYRMLFSDPNQTSERAEAGALFLLELSYWLGGGQEENDLFRALKAKWTAGSSAKKNRTLEAVLCMANPTSLYSGHIMMLEWLLDREASLTAEISGLRPEYKDLAAANRASIAWLSGSHTTEELARKMPEFAMLCVLNMQGGNFYMLVPACAFMRVYLQMQMDLPALRKLKEMTCPVPLLSQ